MKDPESWARAIARGSIVLAVVACGGTAGSGGAGSPTTAAASPAATPAVVWAAPLDPLERALEAGIEPAAKEFLRNHVHAHLDVFIDGLPVQVPAGIGINTQDPDVRRFDEPDGAVAFGGIELCETPCISPLHTHDPSGIIHTESQEFDRHTLGQFFVEWGVALTDTCVGEYCSPETPIAFYVNGTQYAGDPREIELTDRREIAVVVGTPPAEIPRTADFSRA